MVALSRAFGQQLPLEPAADSQPGLSRPAFLFPGRGESVLWKQLQGGLPLWPALSPSVPAPGVSGRGKTDETEQGRGSELPAARTPKQ